MKKIMIKNIMIMIKRIINKVIMIKRPVEDGQPNSRAGFKLCAVVPAEEILQKIRNTKTRQNLDIWLHKRHRYMYQLLYLSSLVQYIGRCPQMTIQGVTLRSTWTLHSRPIERGTLVFRNFTSHFIRVQIFQIDFPLILNLQWTK